MAPSARGAATTPAASATAANVATEQHCNSGAIPGEHSLMLSPISKCPADADSSCSWPAFPDSSAHRGRSLHPRAQLSPLQRDMLAKFLATVDTSSVSLVITNPLLAENPIVYVTEPWQEMCGLTYSEAVGQNPRVTQGPATDAAAIKTMSTALSKKNSCKVRLLNYRGGLVSQPFWNMLSISPITYQGEIKLFMANLQDYSFHMTKMVSLSPDQFCKVAEHHQRQRRVEYPITALQLSKPAVYVSDEGVPLVEPPATARCVPPPIKRLGWNKLILEPEYLTDRVVDALIDMHAEYEIRRVEDGVSETSIVSARLNDTVFRVTVDESADGSYRISCARLSGDTFSYHEAFRALKERLSDAVGDAVVSHQRPLTSVSSGSFRTGVKRPIAAALAPTPKSMCCSPLSVASVGAIAQTLSAGSRPVEPTAGHDRSASPRPGPRGACLRAHPAKHAQSREGAS